MKIPHQEQTTYSIKTLQHLHVYDKNIILTILKRVTEIGYEEAPSVQDATVTTECSSRIVGSEAHHLNYCKLNNCKR